ncbi:hypothetical protein [Streptomyces sp. NPDC040750]|uniref:hypothetical protein n=1 Tax=Streptomyces sp. NPDC040750 TaxID=3154491 RepID=UPI0033C1033E
MRTFLGPPPRTPVVPRDTPGPPDDVVHPTITEPGDVPGVRVPAYVNTLGRDSEVSYLGAALRRGGDQPGFRLVAHRDASRAEVLSVAMDVRQ